MRKSLLALSLVLPAALLPAAQATAQSPADTAMARQAYFVLVGMQMGKLAAMAQGKIAYNADAATAAAKNLDMLSQLDKTDLFLKGSSSADIPGKTRALPAIWEKGADFQAKAKGFRDAVVELQSAAGGGVDALRPAVGKLGGACKACHDEFRAENF